MRHTIFLILIPAVFSFSFMSCKSAKFLSRTEKMQLVGTPSTGYSWFCETGDDSVIGVSEDIKYLGKDEVTGAPSLYLYTIKSLKPGKTTLKFVYKRLWEKTDAEQMKFYEVFVKDNGKIVMKEKNEVPVENKYKSVSMAEGLELMEADGNFILLDVRTPDEYASGHIPGALQLTNETFTKVDAESLIPDKSTRIYVYCRSGRRSKNSSQKLADFGYENVIEIGGIIDYSGEIEK